MGEREELLRKKQELEEGIRSREAQERLEEERDASLDRAARTDLELLLIGSNKNYAKLKEEQSVFLKGLDKAVSARLAEIDGKLEYMAGERAEIVKALAAPIREVKKEYDGSMEYLQVKSKQTVDRIRNTFGQLWIMKTVIILTAAAMLVSTISVAWIAWNISDQTEAIKNMAKEVKTVDDGVYWIYKHDGGK